MPSRCCHPLVSAAIISIALAALTVSACKPERPDLQAASRAESARRAAEARKAVEGGAASLEQRTRPTGLTPEVAATVVASVGETKITLGDFARWLGSQPDHQRARYTSLDARKELLGHMMDLELLALEAKRRGLDQDPIVQHVYKKALAQELLSSGVSTTVSLAEISDEEVKARYERDKERFTRTARRRAAVIMLADEAKTKAILADLKRIIAADPLRAPQIFGDFAAEHSMDPETMSKKGNAGWVLPDGNNDKGQRRLEGRVLETVWSMTSVNEISEPLKLGSGHWALVQLTGVQTASQATLSEVTLGIQSELLQERQAAEREKLITRLRAGATIEIDDAQLAKLPTPEPAAVPEPDPVRAVKPRINPALLRPLSARVPTVKRPGPHDALVKPSRGKLSKDEVESLTREYQGER